MISELQKRLAKFKVPKRIIAVPELPRNAMGKVQKSLLRQTYAGLYMPEASTRMNSEGIDDVNHGDKADEGAQEHERRGGHHSWIEGFARPPFEPGHNGDQRQRQGPIRHR